jgi:hypothetical protein
VDIKGALNHPFLSNITIKDAEFINNEIGVSSNACSNVNLRFNEFTIKDQTDQIGININTTIGYTVYTNVFSSLTRNTISKYGVQVINSSTESNLIDENIFTKMGTAIRVMGINGADITGLQLACNTITQSRYADIFIPNNSSIAPEQGTSGEPAGNEFSHITGIQGSHFYNATGNDDIVYHYSANNSIENPISYLNISLIQKILILNVPIEILKAKV